ncbi:MAG: fumarate reductase subunit D [Chloroflexi bacterium]|nr:fumarate reductase subunit D [Chloroflexota bacterium]
MYKINTIEPLWWGLFGAGGFIAAFLLPVHMLVNGMLIPLGAAPQEAYSPQRLAALVSHPVVKLYLLALVSLPLFHWAHRFRYLLFDLGIHGGRTAIAFLCYGAAIVGTVVAAWTLVRV